MIIKSVIAGLTLGGAAFGGVYYGLPSSTPDGAVKPADMARLEPATPQTQDRRSEDVKIAEAHPHPEKLKPKKTDSDDTDKATADDEPETKWIDNYLKKSDPADEAGSEDAEDTDTDDEADNIDIQDIIDRVKGDIKDETDETDDTDDMPEMESVKTKIVSKTDQDKGTFRVENPATAAETLTIVLREAKAIESDDLKDQAHMDILNYALRNRDYGTAEDIIDLINQPELRETARSRIAVSYAGDGRADDAFDMIDSVEMDDFADVMRLQVIEALTRPKDMSDITK